MKHWRFRHVLRNEAGAGGAAGAADAGGGGAASAAGSGAGAGGAGAGGGATAGSGAAAAGSALAAGAAGGAAGAAGSGAAGAGAGASGAAGADPLAWLPEKYRVLGGADGKTLDLEASARKVAEAHGHLEKRLGSGDAPPASVDGYKVNVPETLKGRVNPEELAKDPGMKADIAKLHAAGASQKVVDAYVQTALERGIAMREALPALQASECEATLRQGDGWKSDQEYNGNIRTAYNAGLQIFGKDPFLAMEKKGYFNDPDFIRGLATIGREMQEDRGPSPEAVTQLTQNLDALMSSAAYLNGNDPKHAETVAKVDALHKQLHGDRALAGGKTISFKTA